MFLGFYSPLNIQRVSSFIINLSKLIFHCAKNFFINGQNVLLPVLIDSLPAHH